MPTYAVSLQLLLCHAVWLVAAAAAAVGTDGLASIKCSTTVWTKQQVDAAVAEGCRLQKANTPIGRSSYPHKFNNYEKLVFAAASPYFEFPIVLNGIYAGGAPGADRVVFNPDLNNSCVYVGAMTHSGASGNGFLSCSEKRDGSGSPSSTESKTKTKTTGTATKTTTGTAQTTLETTAKPDTTGSAQTTATTAAQSSTTTGPGSGAPRMALPGGDGGGGWGLLLWIASVVGMAVLL